MEVTIKLQVLAQANLFNNGKSFCVISVPDWNGGHFMRAIPCASTDELELGDYEYLIWHGTPAKYAEEMPAFVSHCEPLHENPEDYWQTFFGVPIPSVSTDNADMWHCYIQK